jgi:hypothetical protein
VIDQLARLLECREVRFAVSKKAKESLLHNDHFSSPGGGSLLTNSTPHRRNPSMFGLRYNLQTSNNMFWTINALLNDCDQRLLKHFLTVPKRGVRRKWPILLGKLKLEAALVI